MFKNLLLVFLGGGLGSMLRYWVNYCISSAQIPYTFAATFIVNVVGCFLIGFLGALLLRHQAVYLLLITGFCGGFTTFSTFGIESLQMLLAHKSVLAMLYVAASVVVGLLAAWLGLLLARYFV